MARLTTLKPRVQVLNTSRVNKLPVVAPPSQQPGYRVRGRELQRRRGAWLRAHPLCVECLVMTPRRVTPAAQVDHVVPLADGGADAEHNFQSLCIPHHQAKTAREARK